MSSFISQLLHLKDVRSNDVHQKVLVDQCNFSTDFEKFPGLSSFYSFERWTLDNVGDIMRWFHSYWNFSVYLSIVYLVTIFTLQALMSRRQKPFDLRRPLIIWNWSLAIFSFLGCVRCLPDVFHVLRYQGFVESYITNGFVHDIRLGAWYLFFTLSKALELIDTLFIVLRKKPLIKLHWIHHTLTLIYSWFVFGDYPSTARYMVNMNLMVHTLMYSYYGLSAMRIRIPKQINITLTMLQILQMLIGFYIQVDCLRRKLTNQHCDSSLSSALAGFSLYFLFFILFVNFFLRTYVIPNSRKAMQMAMNSGKSLIEDLNNNAQNGRKDLKKLR